MVLKIPDGSFSRGVYKAEDRAELTRIAERYVNRCPCPTKDWPERKRAARILDFAKGWDTPGAIIIQQKFCDPHEADLPALTAALEAAGVRTLALELDVTWSAGAVATRIEAFLEILELDDLD